MKATNLSQLFRKTAFHSPSRTVTPAKSVLQLMWMLFRDRLQVLYTDWSR